MKTVDISQKLQIEVLKNISPSMKIELCEKESRLLVKLNPQYSLYYLRKKFMKKCDDR